MEDIINSLSNLGNNKEMLKLITTFDNTTTQNEWLEKWHQKGNREEILDSLGLESIKNLHNFLYTISAMKLRSHILKSYLEKKQVIKQAGGEKKKRKKKTT
jgi:hypothetical protein